MEGAVAECLQTERIYNCLSKSCDHSAEGGGGDVFDQLSWNPLTLCVSRTSRKAALALHYDAGFWGWW